MTFYMTFSGRSTAGAGAGTTCRLAEFGGLPLASMAGAGWIEYCIHSPLGPGSITLRVVFYPNLCVKPSIHFNDCSFSAVLWLPELMCCFAQARR